MRNLFISIAFILFFILNVHSEEIKFEKGTFSEVLEKAKNENEIVMIDF